MEISGDIALKAGKHAITVTYFKKTRYAELKVFWEGPGLIRQGVPAEALFQTP